MTPHRVTIVGAGLAGTLFARAMLARGWQVRLMDDGAWWRGSGVPGALMHAHPGRSNHHEAWHLEAFRVSAALLDSVSPSAAWPMPVLRPLEVKPDTLPRGTVWLPPRVAARHHPELAPGQGALREPGYGVAVPTLLRELRTTLSCEITASSWRPEERDPSTPVVLACGAALSEWVPHLSGAAGGGAVLVGRASQRLSVLVNGQGIYVVPLHDHRLVMGSTRYPVDQPHGAEEETAHLLDGARALLPRLRVEPERLWRGRRWTAMPDRMPVVGPVGEGRYVLGGMSGKGLLWAPWCAELLARHLDEGLTIPDEVAAHRSFQAL